MISNKLREIFCPTKEQRQKQYDLFNKITKKTYDKYGECCLTCKHGRYIQVHQYYDYTTCEYNKSLEFAYGMGSEDYVCDKYEFSGYLSVEDNNDE